jgi:hypothetical protein
MALVNPDCPVPVTHLQHDNPFILSLQFGQLRIACFYLPPSTSISTNQVMTALDSIRLDRDTLLCGDFNARFHTLTGDHNSNTRGTLLTPWLVERDLTILNSTLAYSISTFESFKNNIHQSSIIDLFITNNLNALQNPVMEVLSDCTFGSDHCLLSLSFGLDKDASMNLLDDSPAVQPRKTWQLSKLFEPDVCNLYCQAFDHSIEPLLTTLEHHIDMLDHNRNTGSKPDFEQINTSLCDSIYSSLDSSIGKRPARPAQWKKYWTPALQQAASWRNECYSKWRRSYGLDKVSCWLTYTKAQKQFRHDIVVAKRLSWRDYCHSLENDFNKATSQIKYSKKKREKSATFSHPNGPVTAAKVMATHMESIYSGQYLSPDRTDYIDHTSSDDLPYTEPPDNTDTRMFSSTTVSMYIDALPRRKAAGIDHIRAEMLQPIKRSLSKVLSLLFRLYWAWSTLPVSYRHAQVHPIHKKGDPSLPSNYRPISLTSTFRKSFEFVIQPAVKRYSPPLDVAQGGFRTKRSALDQAACLHDLIHDYYQHHNCHYPDLAFLDIKNAFDCVDRSVVWKTLRLSGTPAPLLQILRHLFDDVQVSILIANHSSDSFRPLTGFLRGSVLSPMLYSIYINSLPSLLRSFASHITTRVSLPSASTTPLAINSLLFADDVAIFGTKLEVQRMLDAAEKHSRNLGYRWNPIKCAIVNHPIGRSIKGVNSQPLTLYNVAIPQVDSFVYLGIPFTKRGICGKTLASSRVSGTIAAMSTLHKMGAHRSGFSLLLSSRLYTTFIRPKFEYGLAITPLRQIDKQTLEKLQDRCLRMMVGGSPTSSTTVLKIMTKIPSVNWRIDALVTKYCIRVPFLPRNCLLVLLQNALGTQTLLNTTLRPNRLYQSLPDPLPPSPSAIKKLFMQDRQNLFTTFLNTTDRVLAKACRPNIEYDPILYLPARRIDRSRLIRWRMGWLPGHPHDCTCTLDHTSRRHFDKYECEAIPSLPWNDLPSCPPETHAIDHAINLLPTKVSNYCSYWPSLLTLLWYIECNVNPTAFYKEDTDTGALWRDSSHNSTTDTATETS